MCPATGLRGSAKSYAPTNWIDTFDCSRMQRCRGLGVDVAVSCVRYMDGPKDRVPELRDNPTWQDIEAGIRRLDGHSCSVLVLGIGTPVPHMGIGGGED